MREERANKTTNETKEEEEGMMNRPKVKGREEERKRDDGEQWHEERTTS